MQYRRHALLSLCVLFWPAEKLPADEPQTGDTQSRGRRQAAALFDRLDVDEDGKLTSDEIPGDKQALFRRLLGTADKNDDDTLSREEFAAGLESKRPERPLDEQLPPRGPGGGQGLDPEKRFQRLDANNDGKIVADEVPEDRRGMFEKMLARADTDGDGSLTKQEFTAAIQALQPQFDGKPGQMDPAKLFQYLDKDGDGKLTAEEVPPGRPMLERLMKRGDKDGDGALSVQEFSTAIDAARKLQGGQVQASPAADGKTRGKSRAPNGRRGAFRS